MNPQSRIALGLAVVLLVASCSSEAATTEPQPQPVNTTTSSPPPQPTLVPTAPDQEPAAAAGSLDLYDVSDLVKRVRSGVVSVTQERVRLDLFGVPEEVPAGAGTGIVIDGTGLVLTNYHVIEGASRVIVTGEDGRQRDADVVAEASSRDLALLQLKDTEGLQPLPFGLLDSLEVGDPVIAIGNALGLDSTDPTVSAGIVSAKGRTIRTQLGTMQDLVQTDAAINPGNSGGPLLNAAGEVVGVNTAIAGNAQNIGFAISVDTAAKFVERYRLGIGEPFLGVQMVDNSAAAADRFDLDTDTGALIIDVVSPSPARDAGLEQWDVIVRIDEIEISSSGDAVAAITATNPGEVVELEVVRGRDSLVLDATIGERPSGT
jgi:S1-C subfamily serine protease